ncbi:MULTISPECIES: trypsin-like serine protease [unclassified Streptomyces]|uniref:trypsin-like serine protease n=1 Tax=unclassified Streptomyces TaxID=2593676 RepID=UPI002E14A615|nr:MULTISPECIES: trypsin-like serine protease [unclassified Streptomyces]WSR24590.1 trypsin-like serine protease [Streptomyces sp. NBC_01205]
MPTPLASAATEPAAPFASEDGAYPGAAQILAQKGIKLVRGDGNITLADCKADAKQIRVMTVEDPAANRAGTYCFASSAATGLLTLELPRVFAIDAADQPLTASLTADGATKTVTIAKDGYASVGEGQIGGARSTLVEIRVTGPASANAPAPSGDTTLAFAGKLTVGDSKRFCTAALVDPYWVVTAKNCFADNPADLASVGAGAPKDKTTVTVGRTDLATSGGHTTDIIELAPHTDRDLVMARLAKPALDVTPIALSTAPLTASEALTVAGFGRTGTEWAPSKLHSAAFSVSNIDAVGFALTAKTPANATVCKGDAGGPAVRTENGKPALVGITSRSWQGGCLDSGQTATGAFGARIDGAQDWIKQVRFTTATIKNVTSNRCAWVPWQTPDSGAVVKQIDCDAKFADQLWKMEPVAGGSYQIRNLTSNRCMWVPWQTPENGAVVKQIDCDAKFADQLWKIEPVAGGSYQIRNLTSNRCMWVPWQTPENGAVVKQIDCDAKFADQLWKI